MSDRYQFFTSTPIGKLVVKNLGLPAPTPLVRWTEGAPLVDGTVVTGAGAASARAWSSPSTTSASPTSPSPRPASATAAWSSTPPA